VQSTVLQDIRYALRVFRANPALVAVAVISLAIGIGPNSVLFSLIDAFGFRPLPIDDPAQLIRISSSSRADSNGRLSYLDYADIRDHSHLLSRLGVVASQGVGISGGPQPPEVTLAAVVSATYFPTLGVRAAAGRTFLPEEDRTPGTHQVALISDRLWERRFDRDPQIVGKPIRLNDVTCAIVGVLPRGFAGTEPILAPDVWVPTMLWTTLNRGAAATLTSRAEREVNVFARLRGGASIERAQAEMAALSAHLAEAYPDTNKGRAFVLKNDQEARRARLTTGAFVSFAVVGLILLLACANVAGLLLGRSEARRSEIAVRLALGASRGRLVRQLLTESALLSLLAAGAGLLLAFWLLRLVPSLIPDMPVTLNFDFRIDLRVLAFTLAAALLAVPLFGLFPALLASRPDLVSLLKGTPQGTGRRASRLAARHVLVVGQIAVSLALLVSSGLLVRSFLNMRQIDPGFVPRPMIFSTMAPQAVGYNGARAREFYRALLERLRATPGVERATLVRHLPLNNLFGGGATQKVVVPGYALPPGEEALNIRFNIVEPDYFETMGTRIVKGRPFSAADTRTGPGVMLINQTMANEFWPAADPIGRHVTIADTGPGALPPRDCEIVGIVQDGKYLFLNEAPQPYFYIPWEQQPAGEMTVVARVRGDAAQMTAVFRRTVWSIDPAMPMMLVTTLEQHMRLALVVERAIATFVGVLGGLGLFLAVVGLYGVVSFLVSRRTREIGIRMALGARPADVVRDVLRQGGRLAAVGIAIGLALAFSAMMVLGGSLYGVSRWDPLTYGGMSVLVLLVALAGSYVPARRAARVDPIAALRME
jgi:predicted permease